MKVWEWQMNQALGKEAWVGQNLSHFELESFCMQVKIWWGQDEGQFRGLTRYTHQAVLLQLQGQWELKQDPINAVLD